MGIKEVLSSFLDKGVEKQWFDLSTIGELGKSCCQSSKIKIIDFDKAEEIHREKCGSASLKSCDALKFILEEKRIDFIEMKSSKNISKNPKIDTDSKLRKQINKFDFTTKISDSLHILTAISNQIEIGLSGKERKLIKEIPKQAILLTDLNFEENTINTITFTFDFLANMSTNIKDLLQIEIDKLGEDNINNLLKPKLMNCREIEIFYK